MQGESRFEPRIIVLGPVLSLGLCRNADQLGAATPNPEKSLKSQSQGFNSGFDQGAEFFQGCRSPFRTVQWRAATAQHIPHGLELSNNQARPVLTGHAIIIEGLSFMPDEEHLVYCWPRCHHANCGGSTTLFDCHAGPRGRTGSSPPDWLFRQLTLRWRLVTITTLGSRHLWRRSVWPYSSPPWT